MPTKNQRVAAYLPTHINDRFQAFKTEHAIAGDSQALIIILSEFLGVSQEVTHQSNLVDLELQKRVESLEERIAQLKDELLSELRSELREDRSSSIEQAKTAVRDELLSELKGELPKIDPVDGQLELISESAKTESTDKIAPTLLLNGVALAKQLGIKESTLRGWRDKGKDCLLAKTRAINSGVGWIYLAEAKKYQSEESVPSDSLEAQRSELLES